MNNYLIFRTDRIGDFLLTAILIKSIKRNDPDCSISLVSSEKNFEYINTFENIDKVFFLKKGLINKLLLFFSLNKLSYNSIIVHDAKNRSKISREEKPMDVEPLEKPSLEITQENSFNEKENLDIEDPW